MTSYMGTCRSFLKKYLMLNIEIRTKSIICEEEKSKTIRILRKISLQEPKFHQRLNQLPNQGNKKIIRRSIILFPVPHPNRSIKFIVEVMIVPNNFSLMFFDTQIL